MNKTWIQRIGLPRLIIGLFLLALFAAAPAAGVSLGDSAENVLARFGMFSILVLSLIPMVQSGCGLNFGLPIGVVAGILGGVTSIEFGLTGFAGIFLGMLLGALVAIIFGWGYGVLLNKIKGDEMLIATYVGYSFTAFMCMIYLILPYKNPVSVLSYAGKGLSQQIPVAAYWMNSAVDAAGTRTSTGILTDFLSFRILGVRIPVGMYLIFAILALAV